jgi:hypothetical protein
VFIGPKALIIELKGITARARNRCKVKYLEAHSSAWSSLLILFENTLTFSQPRNNTMRATTAGAALLTAVSQLSYAVEVSHGISSGTTNALFGLDIRNMVTWLTHPIEAQKDATEKAKAFVAQLDTVEKVGLVTGNYGKGAHPPCVGSIAAIERLGFDGLCFADGPTGYGRADGTSVFPSGITVAAT